MTDVFDVAAYILKKGGRMSTMKLQKLVYYSQAWSLVWDEKPLFKEKIRAWAGGPVVVELFKELQGRFEVSELKRGDTKNLNKDERETIDVILEFYGPRSGQWLSNLTHKERPWREARERDGVADGDRGNALITLESMADYYGGLSA